MKFLYNPNQASPVKVHDKFDPDSKVLVEIVFVPPTRANSTVYNMGDVMIPTVFTGMYYKVKNPGKSGASEPTWIMIPGQHTEDGTLGLIWEAVAYDLIPPDQTVTACTFAADNTTITVGTPTVATQKASSLISTVPATINEFLLTAHATLSSLEIIDFSLLIKVAQR
jgi:hypothetical protein